MKRFAFVMDPLEKLNLAWDTSLCLLRELARRGHQNFLFQISSISTLSGRVRGMGRLISPLGNHRYLKGPEGKFDLASFDAVLVRLDPPFDPAYLTLTYLLDPLAKQTLVINRPQGIRNANEKLFGLRFTRGSLPTLVSSNPEEILAFQKEIRSDLVIKPLYEKGGKGVFLLKRNRRGIKAALKEATRRGMDSVVCQKFLDVPKGSGDKRILLWKGEILGAFLRIPRPGEFRSNLSLGGRFRPCSITSSERRLLTRLRTPLLREGLLWVGLDVRNGKLIEVNVTSPAGLVELNQLYGEGATERIADDL